MPWPTAFATFAPELVPLLVLVFEELWYEDASPGWGYACGEGGGGGIGAAGGAGGAGGAGVAGQACVNSCGAACDVEDAGWEKGLGAGGGAGTGCV